MVLNIIKKFWYYFVIGILLLIAVLQLVGNEKKIVNDEALNLILDSWDYKGDSATMLKNAVIGVSDAFGVSYAWWNVNSWYERDRQAYDILKGLNQNQHFVLGILYNTIHAGRDYKTDLHKYLDNDYLTKLTNLP